jgi:hypothetical protein
MNTDEQRSFWANDQISGVDLNTGAITLLKPKTTPIEGDWKEIDGHSHYFENGQWVKMTRYEKESPKQLNNVILLDLEGTYIGEVK